MSLTTPSHLQAARELAKAQGTFDNSRKAIQEKAKHRPRYSKYERSIKLPDSIPIYALSTADMSRTPDKAEGAHKWHFTILSMENIDGVKMDEASGRRYIEIERKLSKNARTEYDRRAKDPDSDSDTGFDNVTSVRVYEFTDIALRVKVTTKFVPVNTIVKLSNVYISHWFKDDEFVDLHNAGKVEPQFAISSDGLLFEFLANSPKICDKPIVEEHAGDAYTNSCLEHKKRIDAYIAANGEDAEVYKKVPDYRLKFGNITYFLSTFGRDAEMQAAKASLSDGVMVDRIFTGRKDVNFTPQVYNKASQKSEDVIGFETNILGDQWSGGAVNDEGTNRTRFKIYATAFSSAISTFRIPEMGPWKEFGPVMLGSSVLLSCRENMRDTSALQTADDEDADANEYDLRSKMKIESVVCNLPFNLASNGIPVSAEQAASIAGFLASPSSDDFPAKFAPMMKNPHHYECRHSENDVRAADVICLNFFEGPTDTILSDYHFFAVSNQEYNGLHQKIMKVTAPEKLSILANKEAVEEYYNIQSDGDSSPTYEDDMANFEEKYGVDRNADAKILSVLQSVKDVEDFHLIVYAVKKPILLYADLTAEKCRHIATLFGFEYDVGGDNDFVQALAGFISSRAYPTESLKRARSSDGDEDDDGEDAQSPFKKQKNDILG